MARAESYKGARVRYECDVDAFPPALRALWHPLDMDPSTRSWIDDAVSRPHGRAAMAALAIARSVMSDYDANGLVGAHDMRVLGTDQARRLLAAAGVKEGGSLLDVGAGEGQVTDELAPLFSRVMTTELSTGMARRLRGRGYECHTIDLAEERLPRAAEAEGFDCIALLNVIDRTSHPYRLVERLRSLLRPGGVLLCTVPLPLKPHVHVGPVTVDPEEILPTPRGKGRARFEDSMSSLAEIFFPACGLEAALLSRVPYLCRGDRKKPVIALDDAVFVCRKRPE
ncbi:MAG: SAM-dependent methyltransferase [Polyangiales bacterium]|jgi:SAM-dependent methyltransferase